MHCMTKNGMKMKNLYFHIRKRSLIFLTKSLTRSQGLQDQLCLSLSNFLTTPTSAFSCCHTLLLSNRLFYNSFMFTAKQSRRSRDFPYTFYPHMSNLPHCQHPLLSWFLKLYFPSNLSYVPGYFCFITKGPLKNLNMKGKTVKLLEDDTGL